MQVNDANSLSFAASKTSMNETVSNAHQLAHGYANSFDTALVSEALAR